MTVAIRKLHPHFFGEVSGVDLRKPLTPQEAADIEAGMDKYAVLVWLDPDAKFHVGTVNHSQSPVNPQPILHAASRRTPGAAEPTADN